jgi:hypothetical protein
MGVALARAGDVVTPCSNTKLAASMVRPSENEELQKPLALFVCALLAIVR